MIRPRPYCRRFWLTVLTLPALIWVAAVALAPTGWVRARLTSRLEATTGRSVRIGSVRLGLLGNLRLTDLSFAEHVSPTDPWLKVREARIDIHPGQVIWGCCQPGEVAVDGVAVRVWRRADGRFEFGNLARSSGPTPAPASGPTAPAADPIPPMNLRIADATVEFIDEPNGFRASFTDVRGHGSFRPSAVVIDELRGLVNDGTVRVAARLGRDPVAPQFNLEIQASRVHLDRGLEVIQELVPIVARPDDAIGGMVNLRLALRARGATCPEIRRSLAGQGSILLDPIDLDGSQILSQLRSLGDSRSSHVAAVSSNFVVGDGRISTDDLTIRASEVPLVVAGWTDFAGRFAYESKVDQILALMPREARTILGELKIDLADLAGLRIEGDHGVVRLTVRGRPLLDDPSRPADERTRSRTTARRIRDRFFR